MLSVSDKKIPMNRLENGLSMPSPVVPALNLPTQGLGLEAIGRRLWRQKWVLLVVALLVTLLTAYNTLTTPSTYRAVATIQIEKEGAKIVKFDTPNDTAPDMGEEDPFFRTQYEQLKSRKLAELVINRLDLQRRLFEIPASPSLKARLISLFSKPVAPKALTATDYVNQFILGLYIEPIERTHLVKIFYESTDPTLSAEIVNAVIDEFIKSNLSSQTETDAYAKEFLEQELEKARNRLTMQESKLVEYAKQHNILEVNNSQSSQEKKLDEMYAALGAAERNRIQAESMMLQSRHTGNVRDVLNNPVIEGIKQNLVTLEADYQEKLKLFKPAYPDMQRLEQQIQEVRRQLDSEVGRLKQSLQADYSSAKQVEDKLRTDLDQYKGELESLRDSSIEYNALKREVETSSNLYDGLLQRMKELNVAANVTSNTTKIIDAAVPPDEAFRPKKRINLMLGALVGLMLGTGAALLRETLGQTVASVSELQALSGLPVLGTIPRVRGAAKSKLGLVAVRDADSPVAEAYRVAAANLRFIQPHGAPRVTLITSVGPAEGKSTSATNLAMSQAQQGLKVLLIDADLRKPSLHSKLEQDNSRGLSNFLDGEVEIAVVTQAVRYVKGLYFVPAGNRTSDPVGLLASPVMAQLLRLATKHFDSIIIDAPPVIGFADTIYLSSLAQATVIVTDEDHINRKRLLTAIEQLRRVKRNVVGFLMVKSQENATDYRYYKRPIPRTAAIGRWWSWLKPAKGKRSGLNLAPTNS